MSRLHGSGNGCWKDNDQVRRVTVKRKMEIKVSNNTIVSRRDILIHTVEAVFSREFINQLESDLINGKVINND
jgi:hypothetical protein